MRIAVPFLLLALATPLLLLFGMPLHFAIIPAIPFLVIATIYVGYHWFLLFLLVALSALRRRDE